MISRDPVIKNPRFWFAGLLTVLFVIWPISHTIALRNVLLFVLLAWAFVAADRSVLVDVTRLRPCRRSLLWLLLFTVWMLVELAFTPFWRHALSAINGQWFSALLVALLGALLATSGGRLPRPRTVAILFVGVLLFHVLVVDGEGLTQSLAWILRHHTWPSGFVARRIKGLTAGPDKSNYLTNLLLDITIAELSLRIEKERFLPGNIYMLLGVLAIGFVGTYFEAMRDGLIDIVLLGAFLVSRFVWVRRAQISARVAIGVGLTVLFVVLAIGLDIAFDPRWDTLFATIPIAWNTTAYHAAWQYPGSPLPLLPNGHPVSGSNYLRLAWIKEGLRSVWDYPLGVGYSRSAFGEVLLLRYGHAVAATSTNNGILNLAVGTGVPGVFLWFGWLGTTLRSAFAAFKGPSAFWARALFLVILDVASRNLVDANLQDYMLQQFMFLVGFLGVAGCVGASRVAVSG
ncbi:MAG: hypothetical protein ACYCXG_05130 [Acidiferrobacter sp.]